LAATRVLGLETLVTGAAAPDRIPAQLDKIGLPAGAGQGLKNFLEQNLLPI
jgi:hypothetical protein